MDWQKLLSKVRFGRETAEISTDVRSEYLRDWDRIVYSSAFRRLQDKTQVFPLAESDYVRTRLTHSIEVSSVGRSLGTLVGDFVIKKEQLNLIQPQDFGNIVAAACLAHDIGNPPLGHSGEEAIGLWFQTDGRSYLEGLSEGESKDFTDFEGNAQGFRILTRLQNAVGRGGLQLTYAVLGAFTKYPCQAVPKGYSRDRKKVSEKKFGFVCDDQESFFRIAQKLGLQEKCAGVWARHPLAFLMEAADDICYRIVDLEDGCRLGRVSFEETESLLKPLATEQGDSLERGSYSLITDEKGKVEYLRARAINNLILEVVQVFIKHYDEIMAGNLERDLISLSCFERELSEIKLLSQKKVYSTPNVLHIEAAGFEVLGGLLGKIVPAVIDGAGKKMQQTKSYEH